MERKKTTTRRRTRREAPVGAPVGADAPAPSSGDVLAEARAWAEVARSAYDDCERGQDAESQLELRRNRSGQ